MRAVRSADTALVKRDSAMPAPVLIAVGGRVNFAFTRTVQVSVIPNPNADSSVYLFRADTTAAAPVDTLVFYYQRRLQFLSNACGYTTIFSLDSVRHSRAGIDSILILTRDITTDANAVHARLFL